MADNTRLAREVGAKIKYLRQKRGLSQEALALSCDMNPAFLGHVERGMRSPTLN
ncbi:MAG: helix-turn-helix domain-containing protein, partial [Gemmiger formicilis]